ncbi:DHA2 family efflux MFS transporter permease subunit [Raineyella sp. W15-4]|uniref:DHA2 family efflux MFS transporter permease subunit n=1 Tax=Raineyella sp. W15-4 TaxID=3081651 RepID=UPI0029553E30|nr:DHA2 family efflux MFS transporter permease subunit [Raineyella sp. W15-4]WOQ17818.1 DHA2 family efflux MFS transporter permease subunit [Raineyella sp. W15-4]
MATPMKPSHPFLVLLGPLISGFIGLFSEAALNIALPDFMGIFRISAATVQWLTTGYLLVVGVLLPMSSLLVRWFTTRQLVFTTQVAFVVGAVVSGLSGSFGMLLVGRLIQGIATGILIPLIVSTAVAAFPPQRRGRAMGLIGLVLMFAPAISPVVAGLILELASWKWIFWMMLPFVVASFIVSVIFLRNVREITRPHVDVASIVLSTAGFGLFVFGLSSIADQGWSSPLVYGSLVVGVMALVLFVRRQLRLTDPVLDVRAFTRRNFSVAAATIFVNGALVLSVIYLIPMYLQQGLAVGALAAGLVMLPGGLVNGVFSVWAGRATDLHKPWVLARIGFGVAIVGGLLFLLIGAGTPIWLLILAHSVVMVGVPIAMTSGQTYGLNSLPSSLGADGSTIVSTLQQIGGAVGTALGANLLSVGTQSAPPVATVAAATVTGVRYGFLCALVLAAVGLVLACLFRTPQHASAGDRREVTG